MSKFFCYISDKTNSKNRITTSKLAKMCKNVVANNNRYLTAGIYPSGSTYYLSGTETEVHDDYDHPNALCIDKGVLVTVGNSFFSTPYVILDAGDLDTGTAFTLGSDYYVYICDPSNGDDTIDVKEEYKISLNATYPEGYSESNSRKIGGFHYGYVRKVAGNMIPIGTDGELLGTNWLTNVYLGIVPNSVWTLLHRPKCSPEGMVWLGGDLWGDIYLSSNDGIFGLQSKKGIVPITGTESMGWYGFCERARRVGKRLPTYSELCRVSIGQPPATNANTYGYCSSNNSGRQVVGNLPNATSSYNVRDMVGNVYKLSSDIFDFETSLTEKWLNYQATVKLGGVLDGECGDFYASVGTSIHCLEFGGDYTISTNGGRRMIKTNIPVVNREARAGVWCVCSSINS